MLEKIIIFVLVSASALANLFLGIYVYLKGKTKQLNQNFAFLSSSLFLWSVVNLLFLATGNIFWARFTYATSSLIILTIFFFSLSLANITISKITKIFSYIITIVFFLISFTSFLLTDVTLLEGVGIISEKGPFFSIWVFYLLFFTFIVVYTLTKGIINTDKEKRNQIYYFLFGIGAFAMWTIVAIVFLPATGFRKSEMVDTVGTFFITGFTSYAIIKYNALGIRSFFLKILINSGLLVLVMIILSSIMFLESWVRKNWGAQGFYLMLFVVSVSIFMIGRAFFLKNKDLEEAKISLIDLLQKSREETNKMMTIISNFSDGLLVFNKDQVIDIANPQVEKILKLKKSELIGRKINDLKIFKKDYPVLEVLPKVLLNTFKKENKQIGDLYLEVLNIPFHLGEELSGWLVILHDVTDEKRIENIKSEFVSLAAHQLRTPISGIRWAIESILKKDYGAINPPQEQLLSQTYDRIAGLIVIINDLLNVAKIEEGKFLFAQNPEDIQEIFEYQLNLSMPEVKNKKINFKFEKSISEIPKISVDKEKIRIVFQNLIENAIKYTPIGGSIDASFETKQDNLIFKIKDSGIGIPKAEQKRLFEKFFRSTTAVRADPSGSGLGLFISRNIIEAHNGKIYFESEDGQGTTFFVELPIKE